ncbi:hypothetical protein [Streptomyces erythrochromogenes]|uniref:hypothetical protein n=1 Tax=Streptomyces erythrochromogenes TaxID=285574 RepID=UPI00342D04F8
MSHTDYPLTVDGLFLAEAALRAVLDASCGARTMSPEVLRELADRAEAEILPRALRRMLPDYLLRSKDAERVDEIRDRIYDLILPALNNGHLIDAVEQPPYAYMPMPEYAEPGTLRCVACGAHDKGLVRLVHTRGADWASAIVCPSHHGHELTRAWLAQLAPREANA